MLGKTFKDKITGFQGVCTGYVEYLTGCNQALLAPKCGKDGSVKHAEWFDIQRLDQVGSKVLKIENGPNPGCDRAAPKR